MKLSIGSQSLKVFVKAIHALGKIGDEIYFEWIDEGLTVRSVNSSRSAYACFTFYRPFFTKCVIDASTDDAAVRWKISVKSALTVFRSQASIEKKVERCKMAFDANDARLLIQFFCRQGIIKTYRLSIIDCETLQAVFQLHNGMSCFVVSSRLLTEIVQHFQPGQEEVSISYSPQGMELRNFVEDEAERGKVINTHLRIAPVEFEELQIVCPGQVTCCLKELKGLLSFGEPANLPVKIFIEGPGKPIIFTYEGDSEIASHFVLATLAESFSSTQTTQASAVPMDRAVSFEDIDSETLLAMDEGFEEAMAAVADEHPKRPLERNDSLSKASKGNGEPPPKKHCTTLFASLLEDSVAESPLRTAALPSQRIDEREAVLVSDSDPED